MRKTQDAPGAGTEAADAGPGATPEATPEAMADTTPASGARADVHPIAVVGIGASAGGLPAFTALLRALPPDTGMTFVVVQHLLATHESVLAELLGRVTAMPVVQVTDQPHIRPNHVYVIPPDRNMVITDGVLCLGPRPPGGNRPIDLFFTALAGSHGPRALGVVLSGLTSDGTLGLQAIKAAGGITFAQDDSASHGSMPASAIESGCVDFVLPPAEIAAEIVRFTRDPYVVAAGPDASPVPADGADEGASVQAQAQLDDILGTVRSHLGVDFTQYKSNTLQRRIRRRMALRKLATVAQYGALLRESPQEIEALYQDVLISVTSFFRNPDSFAALRAQVFPRLFAGRGPDTPVRVWVLGCSTGEEAYSLAIALTEYAEAHAQYVPINVYATDLNNASIERARKGLYPRRIAADVSSERLQRFFTETDDGYRISPGIRERCTFARHNALTDPPFARIDLITCRNVLIYMDAGLQGRLLPILHYALRPGGYLFLGPSETIIQQRELFNVEDAKHKLYAKRIGAAGGSGAPSLLHAVTSTPLASQTGPRSERTDLGKPAFSRSPHVAMQREAERVLTSHYVPPGVLINADADVLQFRGDTGLYLTPAPGRANLNLLNMAREGLFIPLRRALQRAEQEGEPAREPHIRIRTPGGAQTITLSVLPVRPPASRERWFWVLFEPDPAPAVSPTAAAEAAGAADVAEIRRLTEDLEATREYLQAVLEERDASTAELQSATEEVQSTNEELQSLNEELETSKEEIQSSNEELTTVNEELRGRNEELNRANDDLNNLFGGVQVAIVMVWSDLRIRRFTPLAEKLCSLIPADVGRPIGDIKLNVDVPDLSQTLGEVIRTGEPQELEIRDRTGRYCLLRVRPYRTVEGRIDGALLVLLDIDALKRGQELLTRQARLLEQVHEAIYAWEPGGQIVYWNPGAAKLYGYPAEEALARSYPELLRTQTTELTRMGLEQHGAWSGQCAHYTRDGRKLTVESTQVLVREAQGTLVLTTDRDVTQRIELEESLRARLSELADADRNKNQFLAMLAHELRNPLTPLLYAVQILSTPNLDEGVSRKARDTIDRQVRILSHLVSDLLDASRVARGKIALRSEPLDLRTVVARAVETARPVSEASRHTLTLTLPERPVTVDGDVTRLEQVFGNVLGNAVKYTPDGGRIDVRIDLTPAGSGAGTGTGTGGTALVRVRDNGIGIDRDLLPRVFAMFSHGDLTHEKGGLGLGLSLVNTLVRLHGGRVEIRSEGKGQGCEVLVRLPLHAGEASPLPVRPELSPVPSPLRVLVVDDNVDVVESSTFLLAGAGHEVRTALSGREALTIATDWRPAAVMLDIAMPDLNGYEVARRMRRLPGLKSVCLIAVSGYDSPEARAESLRAGFDAHLSKPVSLEALYAVLAKRAPRSPED